MYPILGDKVALNFDISVSSNNPRHSIDKIKVLKCLKIGTQSTRPDIHIPSSECNGQQAYKEPNDTYARQDVFYSSKRLGAPIFSSSGKLAIVTVATDEYANTID